MAETTPATEAKAAAPKGPPLLPNQQRALDIKEGKIKPSSPKVVAKPTGPMFHITPSITAVRKNLTPAQRRSPWFTESPRIGAKTLRRGQTLVMSSKQMEANDLQIQRLFKAGAIEIVQVLPTGKRIDLRDEEREDAKDKAELLKSKKMEVIKKASGSKDEEKKDEKPKGKEEKKDKKGKVEKQAQTQTPPPPADDDQTPTEPSTIITDPAPSAPTDPPAAPTEPATEVVVPPVSEPTPEGK